MTEYKIVVCEHCNKPMKYDGRFVGILASYEIYICILCGCDKWVLIK